MYGPKQFFSYSYKFFLVLAYVVHPLLSSVLRNWNRYHQVIAASESQVHSIQRLSLHESRPTFKQ